MNEYISNRVKQAEKIESISVRTLILEDGTSLNVSREYLAKHQPQVGGYYIRYPDDGYESFCPADVFDRTHTISGAQFGTTVGGEDD
jgi:hypothetical protein